MVNNFTKILINILCLLVTLVLKHHFRFLAPNIRQMETRQGNVPEAPENLQSQLVHQDDLRFGFERFLDTYFRKYNNMLQANSKISDLNQRLNKGRWMQTKTVGEVSLLLQIYNYYG